MFCDWIINIIMAFCGLDTARWGRDDFVFFDICQLDKCC